MLTNAHNMVKQTIQIFCRVKPTKSKYPAVYAIEEDELIKKATIEFAIPKDSSDGFINNKKENYTFGFQKCFEQTARQEEVFDHVAKGVIENVLSGYNGTIFAYGQTGSGKTFTITGGAEKYDDRGIIPRTLSYIFKKYEEDKEHIYSTEVSYLEIYNDSGFDLLDPRHEATKLEDLPKVALMEDTDQNVHLKNLSVLPAQNEEDALNLLFLGDTNRMIAETPMNQASTRSHCIFTIHITSRSPGSATIKRSKLHLVDLAGSERISKTKVGGQLLTEAKYINLSLHYLEQVIVALSDKKRQHIPYRNSMMTSVLRDSLGGNCMTTMIATVSVENKNVDESISTCRFAQRVAMIKNEATLNEELDPKLMIIRLKKEVQSLREELAMLTGEERSEELTPEECTTLDEMVRDYLNDGSVEATLNVGADARKIQYCYRVLKTMVKERPPLNENTATAGNVDVIAEDDDIIDEKEDLPHLQPHEIERLKEILVQRDNEISILVNMLKKERKRTVSEAPAELTTNGINGASPDGRRDGGPVTNGGYNKDMYSNKSNVSSFRSTKSRIVEHPMSAGRQEAYEIYKRDHADFANIQEQKEALKKRYVEAKALGQRVNDSRNDINQLKSSLDRLRRQMAVRSSIHDDDYEESEREKTILKDLDMAKIEYKTSFNRLKTMKAEIDHLHHLLDKARVQMQHDFDKWWEYQQLTAGRGDVMSGGSGESYDLMTSSRRDSLPSARTATSRPNSRLSSFRDRPPSGQQPQAWRTPPRSSAKRHHNPVTRSQSDPISPPVSPRENYSLSRGKNALTDLRGEEGSVRKPPHHVAPVGERSMAARFDRRPTSGRNSVSSRDSGKSIPLTGDKETDANILAFVKARESLMRKKR